jgi:signal transduction histidine kinase
VTALLRRIPQPVRDWAAPLALFAIGVGEVLTKDAFAGTRPVALAGVAAFTLPFGVRRRWPAEAVIVAWLSCAVASVASESFFNLQMPFLLLMWSAFIAGGIPELPRALAALGAMAVGLTAVNLTFDESVLGDYLFPGGFALAMWLGTRTLRNRTLLAAELHEQAARAEERREEAAARAIAEERRRIAREMHDLVGHSVSVMVVQAGGARRILDRDPERAIEAAVRIEATGRAALAEMRRLLGLLGPQEGDAALAPQPTLDDLNALVDRARAAGLPVHAAVEGERGALPPGAEAAAYRVVQEALTNALKHAGAAPTDVLLRWGPEALEIVVSDRGAGMHPPASLPSGGHGIVGMRERVKLYGGELTADPQPDGGFVVRARIPLGQESVIAA